MALMSAFLLRFYMVRVNVCKYLLIFMLKYTVWLFLIHILNARLRPIIFIFSTFATTAFQQRPIDRSTRTYINQQHAYVMETERYEWNTKC
uniref:Hypothetical secreted peptide n=1 Tax=Glossina morsitans morsitans TaxID=37546 RepID=D3TSP8_GLOMM